MVSRKLLIAISIVVVAVVVVVAVAVGLWTLMGLKPPVDVYARATPSSTAEPESLLPSYVAGMTCTDMEPHEYAACVDAVGIYEGDIRIEITRFNLVGNAIGYVDGLYEDLSGGSMAYVSTGDKHWFTHTVSDQSVFVWRKGMWVFEVSAPTKTLRNNVVEELNF